VNPHLDDTIVAVSTPPGRGGIGVVRLAGEQAIAIARQLLRTSAGKEVEFHAGRAVFALVIDADSGERIDEAIVTYFQAPHSYTGEDIVEISAHGSPVILRYVVEQAMNRGARLAEPGEFTMRAFLNGRIDLTQAEAVRDLIDSQTLFQAKAAAQQLNGALSKRVQPIKADLMNLIATLEAGVDFAEDDVAVLPDEEIIGRIDPIVESLEKLSQSIAYGKLVHQGVTLAIVGRPNVGKSSLFNRLVERDHAIVTATPGTTRDLVSETVSLGGIPVKLIDTAGLRESQDEAEKIGIEKSYTALADADIVLVVSDASAPNFQEQNLWDRTLIQDSRAIYVQNKIDLLSQTPASMKEDNKQVHVRTSALRGEGIKELRAHIIQMLSGESSQQEPGFLTNERQSHATRDALIAMKTARTAVHDRLPHEVLLLDLYAGLKALDSLTGQTSTDDILQLIFAGFCIGK
jgi:tRNA modification GTPase